MVRAPRLFTLRPCPACGTLWPCVTNIRTDCKCPRFVSGLAPEKIFPFMGSPTGNKSFRHMGTPCLCEERFVPVPHRKESLASFVPEVVSIVLESSGGTDGDIVHGTGKTVIQESSRMFSVKFYYHGLQALCPKLKVCQI